MGIGILKKRGFKGLMSLQDPISDMLTRIRNAHAVRKKTVQMPYSKLKLAIAKLLKEEGYLEDCQKIQLDKHSVLHITLKYYLGRSAICRIYPVSKPGLRVYKKKRQLLEVLEGLGIAIVSTSSGLMTGRRARSLGYGGEVLCYVY